MRVQSVVVVILLVLTTSLQAQVIPGRWEKLDSQPAGKEIIVILKAGDHLDSDELR